MEIAIFLLHDSGAQTVPVQNGRRLQKAIRALDRPDAKAIPIIAMTANVFKEDREKCRRRHERTSV